MEEITISKAQELASPNPFALVCAKERSGGTNMAAISWWTFISNSPPTLAFCAKHGRYTGQCAAESGAFALCLPGEAMKEKAFLCGTVSGQKVNKAEEFDIELFPCRKDGLRAVRQSRLVFVCELSQIVPLGDHDLYIGKIEKVLCDPTQKQLYAFDGYKRLDTVKQ